MTRDKVGVRRDELGMRRDEVGVRRDEVGVRRYELGVRRYDGGGDGKKQVIPAKAGIHARRQSECEDRFSMNNDEDKRL